MKNIRKYIGAALLSLAFVSCHVADVSEYATLSDVSWYLSSSDTKIDTDSSDGLNQKITLSANGRLSLMDLSQGMNSHQWIVTEDESIKFLEGTLPSYSPTTEEIEEMVADGHPYTTDKKTINLWFTAAGDYTVTLLNKFPYEAGFTYNSNVDWRDITVTADKVNNEWIWEENFQIKVYSSTLYPEVKVYRDEACIEEVPLGTAAVTEVIADEENGVEGVEGVEAQPTQVFLTIGDTLYFKDATWGDPDSWTWTCSALGTTYYTQDAEFTFNAATTPETEVVGDDGGPVYDEDNNVVYEYATPIQVTFKPGRTANTTIGTTSVYNVETLTIPLDIIVLDSEDEIIADAPVMVDTNTLTFTLKNASFHQATSFVTGDFKLTHCNNYLGRVQDDPVVVNISAVALSSDYTKLTFTTGDMYNTDDLQLTYIGGDKMVNYNSNKLTSAIEIPLAKTSLNESNFYDFEDDAQFDNWEIAIGNSSYTTVPLSERYFAIVDDPADTYNTTTGKTNRCLMFKTEGTDLSTPLLQEVLGSFNGTGTASSLDTYKIYFDFYVTKVVTTTNLQARVQPYPYLSSSFSGWGYSDTGGLYSYSYFSSPILSKANSWTYGQSGTRYGGSVKENMKIAFVYSTAYEGILYLDNIYITNAETRD